MDLAQQRQQQSKALADLGIKPGAIEDEDLDKLWAADYRTLDRLQVATREGLTAAKLLPGTVDFILSFKAAALAAQVAHAAAAQAAAQTGAAAGLGPGSAAGAGICLQELQRVTENLKQISLDIARSSSASQPASKITRSRLEDVRQALGVVRAPVPGDPTLADLFEAQDTADDEQADFTWIDDVMEDRQCDAVMHEIMEQIGRASPQPSSGRRAQVMWFSGRGIALTHRFGDMPFSIKGKNDEVLGVTSFGKDPEGAVLGVELKKQLSWQGVRQAETEFYLWQSSSQYPFCQVITDMKIGCAYYFEGVNPEGHLVLRVRVFGSMPPLYNFMAELINGLPSDLNDQLRPRAPPSLPVSFPQLLSAPQRIKPPQHAPLRAERSASVPPFIAALKLISEMRDAEDDIANLRDVADWQDYYS